MCQPLLTGAMQCPVNFSEAADFRPQWPPRGLSVAHAGSRVPGGLGRSLALYRFCSREQRALAPSCDLLGPAGGQRPALRPDAAPLLPPTSTRPSTGAYGGAAWPPSSASSSPATCWVASSSSPASASTATWASSTLLHPQPTAAQARLGCQRRWPGRWRSCSLPPRPQASLT